MTNEAAPSNTSFRCQICGKWLQGNVYHICSDGQSYEGTLEVTESDTSEKLDRIIELLEKMCVKLFRDGKEL